MQRVALSFALGLLTMLTQGCGSTGCYASGETRDIDDFDDFDTTRDAWVAEFNNSPDEPCRPDEPFPFVLAGECEDRNLLVLYRGDGYSNEIHFFDATSRRFLGYRSGGDAIDPICFGRNYWPRYITCSGARVTAAPCGNLYAVGDPLSLR